MTTYVLVPGGWYFQPITDALRQQGHTVYPITLTGVGERHAAERIYHEWDKALSNDDVDALMALYAPDVVFESPAVPLTMGTQSGVCHGHDELRPVLERVAARKPPLRTYYRTGYLTDGQRTMIFEYPRNTPDGEQMDFVEVMEIADGLIQRHCVYWGWRGVKVIQDDAYHK